MTSVPEWKLPPAPPLDRGDPTQFVAYYPTDHTGMDLFEAMEHAKKHYRRTCEQNAIERVTRVMADAVDPLSLPETVIDGHEVPIDASKIIRVWARRVVSQPKSS